MIIVLSIITILSGFPYISTKVFAASYVATVLDGVYTISSMNSGLMINGNNGIDANGTKITSWKFDGTIDQRIYVKYIGNGKYLLYVMFSSNGTNRVIDVYRGNLPISAGQYFDIWTPNDRVAQEFYINQQPDGSFTFEIPFLA